MSTEAGGIRSGLPAENAGACERTPGGTLRRIGPGSGVPAEGTEAARHPDLESVARDFESLLVAELLKAARATGSAAWLGGEDAAADAALGMAEQELARAIARGGGLGLARLVVQGLESGATRSSSAPPPHTPARP